MTLTREDLYAISQLLDTKLQPVQEDIRSLKTDVQVLKEDVRELKEDVQNLQIRVHGLELHMENVTDRNIQLLVENYMPAAIRYETAISQMETMRVDIEIIKKVVIKHSQKIQALG